MLIFIDLHRIIKLSEKSSMTFNLRLCYYWSGPACSHCPSCLNGSEGERETARLTERDRQSVMFNLWLCYYLSGPECSPCPSCPTGSARAWGSPRRRTAGNRSARLFKAFAFILTLKCPLFFKFILILMSYYLKKRVTREYNCTGVLHDKPFY